MNKETEDEIVNNNKFEYNTALDPDDEPTKSQEYYSFFKYYDLIT